MTDAQATTTFSGVPTYETGVFLALNAIANAILVMNAPRCPQVRGLKVFRHNDLASTVLPNGQPPRLLTSRWDRYEDVIGDESTFAALLGEALSAGPEQIILAFQNAASLVSGFDLAGLCGTDDGPGPVVVPLDGPRLDQDHLAGYDEVLSRALPLVLVPGGREVDVLLCGHLYCRNEADERANVAELKALLGSLGLTRSTILFSGEALDLSGLKPGLTVAMPYAGSRSAGAAADLGLEVERLGLPLGIDGTRRWLESVAALTGQTARGREVVDRELGLLIPDIKWAVADHLVGRSALVVADRHLGPALVAFLEEVGIATSGWIQVSKADGQTKVEAPYCEPSPDDFARFIDAHPVDFVIGNGTFSYLARERDLPCIEIGYPSFSQHRLFPRPYLGFKGVRCLVESILNALIARDERVHVDRS